MKLNQNDKDKIRNIICEELNKVSLDDNDFKRIKLDKELLEDLLFLKTKDSEDRSIKLPIWSGEFLQKLDLSDIDFEDVSYSILYDMYIDRENKELDSVYEYIKRVLPNSRHKPMVYYGNTNANIDFKNSFEYKKTGKIKIHGFNFTGTDLSNNDINEEFDIIHGYFKDTNLRISTIRDNSIAVFSDFTGIDLSYYETDLKILIGLSRPFDKCIIRDTGIDITPVYRDMGEYLEEFIERYKCREYDGCYINGVYVKSNNELVDNRKKLMLEHYREVSEIISKVREKIRN